MVVNFGEEEDGGVLGLVEIEEGVVFGSDGSGGGVGR